MKKNNNEVKHEILLTKLINNCNKFIEVLRQHGEKAQNIESITRSEKNEGETTSPCVSYLQLELELPWCHTGQGVFFSSVI